MTMTQKEIETVEGCLRNLTALEGCQAEFTPAEKASGRAGNLDLRGPWGKQEYQVITRLRVSVASADVAIHQVKSLPEQQPALLFSDFLSDEVSGRLRQSGVDFVDTAGNAHLVNPPLYLEVSGRKRLQRPPRIGRAFQPAGLKLLYLLLRAPLAIRWTYRDLAQEAGIALGAVGTVLQELEETGHLDPHRPVEKNLLALNDLLTRWQISYKERLRPKLFYNRSRLASGVSSSDLCRLINQHRLEEQVLIGGELGASLLLQKAPSERASLHISGEPLRIMLQLHLVPDPNGPVTLLHQFGRANQWPGWQPEGVKVADPLLLHAEVLSNHDNDAELLTKLYKRYLEPRLAGEQPE